MMTLSNNRRLLTRVFCLNIIYLLPIYSTNLFYAQAVLCLDDPSLLKVTILPLYLSQRYWQEYVE